MFSLSKTRVLAAAMVLSLGPGAGAAQTVQNDCNPADHAWITTWFPHNDTQEPPATLSSDSFCAFHVWSAQMFLWLTQTDSATGEMRLLGLNTVEELFAPVGTPRLARSEQPLKLRPRLTKSDAADLGAILQAGSAGVLVDHDGRAIYYEQFFNDAFADFTRSRFFGSGGTFDPALLKAATGVNDFFPAGVMELKTSWKILDAGEPGYLTTQAEVHLLTNQDDKIVVDPDQTQLVMVGLVGLHIAGTVSNHPEMIWATFEHRGNAPDLPAGMAHDSPDPVSASDFLFYTGGTPAKDANQNPAGKLVLDEANQTLSPIVQVFRQFTDGTPNQAIDGPLNVADIAHVDQVLQDGFQGSDDPTANYLEVGAVWMTPNSLQPDQFPMSELRGSTMLSNATMETYTQNDQNCFSCHNTLPNFQTVNGTRMMLPGTNFNISHALVQEYFRTIAGEAGLKVHSLR